MSETKVCCTCKVEKATGEFYCDKATKDGFSKRCKTCQRAASTKYINDHKTETRTQQRRYVNDRYKNDPVWRQARISLSRERYRKEREKRESCPKAREEFRKKHREKARRHAPAKRAAVNAKRATPEGKKKRREDALKIKYKLSPEQWDAIQEKHHHCCWSCGKHKGVGKLVVDHCHATMKVRGALCPRCNRVLGSLGDTLDEIKASAGKLIKYVEDAETLDVRDL